ncbi:hypothetical protein BHM03_00025778 [Ensete ventricosum]|nr:hypothetical protein BHM03_00025778 [Ensete ventricosum]
MRLQLRLRRKRGDDSDWWQQGWRKGSDCGWRGLWLWLRLLEQVISGYAWVEQRSRAAGDMGGEAAVGRRLRQWVAAAAVGDGRDGRRGGATSIRRGQQQQSVEARVRYNSRKQRRRCCAPVRKKKEWAATARAKAQVCSGWVGLRLMSLLVGKSGWWQRLRRATQR